MILDEIVKRRFAGLLRQKGVLSLAEIKKNLDPARPIRDFKKAVSAPSDDVRIIAEVKKASPSRGVIRDVFNPLGLAKEYEANGAAAVSVLTEEAYFQGSLEHLKLIKENTGLPVLRKDFIIDEYQIYEARSAGADAILLIAAILDEKVLKNFIWLTEALGMAALIEVHDEEEIEKALEAGVGLIGVNNRDLKTFKVDINTTIRLLPLVPKDKILVSESGIRERADILMLKKAGVSAFLIGEALIKEKDAGKKLRGLIGKG
ncbi:MAG: indole-3-glycerol phosphate synthase TrpC [Deltaproteobacteria bacterium]|nr:indole-3-glycerol phosphate synthase TrpC [Deltaproteobacteria bacterium]